MGQISSINFKKTNAIQTRHNDRDLAPNYLLKSGGRGVECNRSHKEALELRNKLVSDAMLKYQEVVKQPFKAKSYEWSAVCNIKETTTMQDLETLSNYFQKEWGFQCYQIAIHRDEGHIDEQGKEQINQHAHLEFITLDKETGKNRYRREIINRKALSKIQDDVAKILGMERGVLKKISGRKRIEPRAYAQIKEQEHARHKQIEKSVNDYVDSIKGAYFDVIDFSKEAIAVIEFMRKQLIGKGLAKETFREIGNLKREAKDVKDDEALERFREDFNEFVEAITEIANENVELKSKINSLLKSKISVENQKIEQEQPKTIKINLKLDSVNLNTNNQKQQQSKPKGLGRK